MAILVIGPSIAYIPLTKGQFALIDEWNIERVCTNNWHATWAKATRHFYAAKNAWFDGHRKPQRLQDFILGYREGFTVDHKLPGNGLDCREANLRYASRGEQNHNQRLRKDSTSGYRGVNFHKVTGKWAASIRFHGKRIHLGVFDTKEEAYAVYCVAAKHYYGEFAKF